MRAARGGARLFFGRAHLIRERKLRGRRRWAAEEGKKESEKKKKSREPLRGKKQQPRLTFDSFSALPGTARGLSPLRSFRVLFDNSPPSRGPARPSIQSGVPRSSLAGEESRQRERLFFLSSLSTRSESALPDFQLFLRLSSVDSSHPVPLSISPTASSDRERWAMPMGSWTRAAPRAATRYVPCKN